MSRVVLFAHPGGEIVPQTHEPTVSPWNTGAHVRKFLLTPASIALRAGSAYESADEVEEVAVWAEWEPPTVTAKFAGRSANGLPRAWHRPVLTHDADPPPYAQNTDPWIFGEQMRYSNCRQQRWAALRELDRGDVIFFGSLLKQDQQGTPTPRFNFFLDTVFVVENARPYFLTALRKAPPRTDAIFQRLVLDRLGADFEHPFTLYDGAMLRTRQKGMFSWVPCAPIKGGDPDTVRFRRPLINDLLGLADLGNSARWRGRVLDMEADDAWDRVRRRCVSLGLSMGTRFPLRIRQTGISRTDRSSDPLSGSSCLPTPQGRRSVKRRASCD